MLFFGLWRQALTWQGRSILTTKEAGDELDEWGLRSDGFRIIGHDASERSQDRFERDRAACGCNVWLL
jgi:hypothetical protein